MIRSIAPMRISFAGGGTDVPPYPERYGGAVTSTTINYHAHIVIGPDEGSSVRVRASDLEAETLLSSWDDIRYDGVNDLAKATIKVLKAFSRGYTLTTFCDTPPGSGLGSSSTLVVAMIGGLSEFFDLRLSQKEVAELAYHIERVELAMKGGLQDQFAAAFGGFNFIEFTREGNCVTPLRLKEETIDELSSSLLLFDTGHARFSSSILERQIKAYERKDQDVIANLAVIKALAFRVRDMLLSGNVGELGTLLDQEWQHKKNLDTSISNAWLDELYEQGRGAGALGGKVLGAGGGGHLLLFCHPWERGRVIKALSKLGCRQVHFAFEGRGVRAWRTYDSKGSEGP